MTMPTGWMDSETALLHARRGAWAYRMGDNGKASIYAAVSVAGMRSVIGTHESWKFLAPHPDDEPAAGAVEPSPDPVALVLAALRAADTIVMGRGRGDETTTEIAALLIEAGFRPPTPEAVETVRGVSRE